MNKLATFLRESRTARFFIPLGLILIIFGVLIFIINSKNQNYIAIDSTITGVESYEDSYTDEDGNHTQTMYNLTVKYTVDGKEYEAELSGQSKHKVGDNMKIYYNPSDPSKITQTKSMILPLVIIALGIASLVGGIVSIVNAVKRQKALKIQEESWKNGE